MSENNKALIIGGIAYLNMPLHNVQEGATSDMIC